MHDHPRRKKQRAHDIKGKQTNENFFHRAALPFFLTFEGAAEKGAELNFE
jgi:hypothetical protein